MLTVTDHILKDSLLTVTKSRCEIIAQAKTLPSGLAGEGESGGFFFPLAGMVKNYQVIPIGLTGVIPIQR